MGRADPPPKRPTFEVIMNHFHLRAQVRLLVACLSALLITAAATNQPLNGQAARPRPVDW